MQISKRNIPFWMLRSILSNLPFFFSIWYIFETQFTDIATLGIIYGVSQLLTILLEIPSGYFADRFGRKLSALVGYLTIAISWVIVGSTVSVVNLWIGYIINGIGLAFVSGATTALDYDTLKQDNRANEYSKWMSLANVLANISVAISIIAGGYIFGIAPRWTYFGVAISMILTTILMAFTIEPTIKETSDERITFKSFFVTLKRIFKDKNMSTLLVYYVLLGGLAYSFIFVFALIYATKAYPHAIERSYFLAGIISIVAVLTQVFERFFRNKQDKSLLLWGLVTSFGYIAVGIYGTFLAPLWLIVLYVSYNTRIVIIDQFIHDCFPSLFRTTLFSVLNLGASIIAFFALTFGPKGIEIWGIEKVFLGMGVVSAVIIIWYFLFTKRNILQ